MGRFRRRSVTREGGLSSTVSGSQPFTSVVTPCESSLSSSLRLNSDRDTRKIGGILGVWPSKPSLLFTDLKTEYRHAYAEAGSLQPLTLSIPDQQSVPSLFPIRRPRHIPIIIPDYVSPHEPPQQTPLLRTVSSFPDSLQNSNHSIAESTSSRELTNPPEAQPESASLGHTMNSSQISLSASESGVESVASSIHLSQSQTNLASQSFSQPNINAANVSSFVCNVHRTSGQEPPPLVGATTTILGDKLYVFGGRVHSKTQPDLSADLYELDLIRRHWTKLDTVGSVPPPRYFHSMCALGDTKLVCYGGMSPAAQVQAVGNENGEGQPGVAIMSDIHIYDAQTRKWTLIQPTRMDSPEGRYAHCATILPSSAVFATAESHVSAIHNNPSSDDPHSGVLGVQIDGTGGAEMVVVGGQDRNNDYIQQISVFNLRNLKWTSSTPYDRNCGAYKSMVVALPGISAQAVGTGKNLGEGVEEQSGTPMLVYSNYNFLDVRLELQLRHPDGQIEEKQMSGTMSPPGLRFPNGGVIDDHFVVSGTYLTSSKHEYALWALDLKTLTWAMIDTAGTIFGQGSWNRGVLWSRRNTYVILGHRKRNLVDDYNARRLNFSHMCVVELEAYGLYDNPRRKSPCSAYVSNSAPAMPVSMQQNLLTRSAGGRQLSEKAAQLGQTVLHLPELCDMEIVAHGGEKIPCNSSILGRRWGPYFNHLMQEATSGMEGHNMSEVNTLRPSMNSRASRISALTITPKTNGNSVGDERSQSRSTNPTLVEPGASNPPAASRMRALYLPHIASTINLMLQFLYTSALPPLSDPLCTPHALCSLLQMARPYQIDGLQEATIERLHEALEGRNAAAVFNAAAMAAGGGRAVGIGGLGTLEMLERRESAATTVAGHSYSRSITEVDGRNGRDHKRSGSGDSNSTATSRTTSTSVSDTVAAAEDQGRQGKAWTGEHSSVIGLQKRGLRGLIEGRRMREREVGRDTA